MNNNRGIKSLKNDIKRIIILTKKQRKKLQEIEKIKNDEELKKLEKKVKQLQIISFFKTVPLIVIGSIFKSTANTIDNLVTPTKNDSKNQEKIKSSDIINNKDDIVIDEDKEKEGHETNHVPEKDNSFTTSDYQSYTDINIESDKNVDNEKLDRLKDKRLVKHYEEQLKEKRTEIKLLAASIPYSASLDIYYEKSEKIYKKINLVLKKLEDLEYKISVNGEIYDGDYLKYLIDEYTKEFDDGKLVDEVKDSELYREISIKINKLEEEKEKIKELSLSQLNKIELVEKQNVEEKENTNEKEINFNNNNDDYQIDQINEKIPLESTLNEDKNDEILYETSKNEYNNFLDNQEQINTYEAEQLSRAKTELEMIKIQVESLKMQCEALKNAITGRNLIKPSIRNARLVAVTVLTSVFNMRQVLKNKRFKRRRKLFKKVEYVKSVEKDMGEIAKVSDLINKSYQQVDSLIAQINNKYSSYAVEYQSLLDELEKIKRILKEREYEIEWVKNQQNTKETKVYNK